MEGSYKSWKNKQQIGFVGMVTFMSYIANNMIWNCDIAIDNINRAHNIYGTTVSIIKGDMNKKYNTESHAAYI